MSITHITVRGARQHNLRNVSVSIPRNTLTVITGLSGSGKGTVLKAFEDLGYYSVDNLPIGLIPKFAELAEAVGVRGIRLERPEEVETGIAAALAHKGPVLVDAVVNRMELAMPPKVQVEMAKGFSLYMLKAVLDGRATDLLELARSNVLR